MAVHRQHLSDMGPKRRRTLYLPMGLPRVPRRYGDPPRFYQMGSWAPRHRRKRDSRQTSQSGSSSPIAPSWESCYANTLRHQNSRSQGTAQHATDLVVRQKTKLSEWYKSWELDYSPHSRIRELDLPRATLARLLSIRSMHGDFAWYHRKFNHNDAKLTCSCGRDKTPEHLALCRKTLGAFGQWPLRPPLPPSSRSDGLAYTASLIGDPEAFKAFTQLTQYYTKVCPR
jgi:hypothetical protein